MSKVRKMCWILGICLCVVGCGRRNVLNPTQPLAALDDILSFQTNIDLKSSLLRLKQRGRLYIRRDSVVSGTIYHQTGIALFRCHVTRSGIEVRRPLQEPMSYGYDKILADWGIQLRYEWVERIILGRLMLPEDTYSILPKLSPPPRSLQPFRSLQDSTKATQHLRAILPVLQSEAWLSEANQVIEQHISHSNGHKLVLRYTYVSSMLEKSGAPSLIPPYPVEIRMHLVSLDPKKQAPLWRLTLKHSKVVISQAKGDDIVSKGTWSL